MSAPLKAVDGSADLPALMTELATRARAAARVLALAPADQKNEALRAMQAAILANAATILAANAEDVAEARAGGANSAFIDRLTLTQARIDAMVDGIAIVREIPDPIGVVTESWQRPNGMVIERVTGHELQLTNPDESRSYVGIYLHENRLYILDATAAKNEVPPIIFQQSFGFLDPDGKPVQYSAFYFNRLPPARLGRGGASAGP